MTRSVYITRLEEIRNTVKSLGEVHNSTVLTDKTMIESERHKKTEKLIRDLNLRLYEDIAVSMKVAVDKTEQGEQADLFDEGDK